MNFGYEEGHIYFHSAPEGRKINIIKKNGRVCFNVVTDVQIDDENGCKVKYQSVTGAGLAHIVEDPEEKVRGVKALMRHTLGHEYDFPLKKMDSVLVVRIDIRDIKAKHGR